MDLTLSFRVEEGGVDHMQYISQHFELHRIMWSELWSAKVHGDSQIVAGWSSFPHSIFNITIHHEVTAVSFLETKFI